MNRETAHAAAVPAPGSTAASAAIAGVMPALPAIVITVAILVVLGLDNGGYFPSTFMAAGAVAFLALAALVLTQTSPARFSTPALVALGALTAFACWAGLSSAWSTVPDVPLLDMQRTMLYLALLALALLAADTGLHARWLLWSVLGAVVFVVGTGVLSRLQPDVLAGTTDEFTKTVGGYRLGYPLDYWNAFGALAAIGAVLAIGLTADRRGHALLRAAASGAAVLLLVGLYLSLSRGAWLALILGVLALIVFAPAKGSLLVSMGVVGVALAIALLRLRAYPALVSDPAAGGGQAAQGNAFTGELVLLVLAAAVTQGVLASKRFLPGFKRRAVQLRKPALMGATALAVVVVLGGLVVADAPVTKAGEWIDRQWDDFMNPTTSTAGLVGTQRLLTAKGQRSATYGVALDAFAAKPLQGEGAGSFEVRWARTGDLDLKFRDAHSLPLETLGELGAVGMALLLGLFGAVAVAAQRGLRGRGAIRRAEAAAVTAACMTWLAHASVDWDWEMPVVTGTALVLAATLFQRGRRRRSRSVRPPAPG